MAIGNHNDLTHIVRTSDQWKNTYDKYELIPNGVLCVELVSSDVTKIKIGDGHNIFSKLPYIGDLDLSKYYTKLETDTRIKEILSQEKVVRIKGILNSKSDLPADARCGDIYFVRQLSSSDNKYIEYIYSPDNTWEPLGGIPVDIDLSEYAKTAYVDDKIEQVNERIDDIEQHGTHTHPNKEILDQITEPYTTADKETLASLHNYDDTEIREMISQSSHTHANKEILDATSAAFTREDKSKLDQLNPYDDSVLKEKITALERLAHEHSNKRILDQTTASFTKEYERKMRWIRIYTGCTGMEEGIAGLVPAAQAGEEDYVLSGSGEWVPQTGGGGTYTLPIATASTLGGIKVGNGLEIDANGVLSTIGGGGGGGDTVEAGNGIDIDTDSQTGNKIISVSPATANAIGGVKIGDGVDIDENGVLTATMYEAGTAISIAPPGALQPTTFSSTGFVSAINQVSYGSVTKSADNLSFTIRSSGNDCYTQDIANTSNGVYAYNILPSTTYRLTWDSDDTLHEISGRVMIFENGGYSIVHTVDQIDESYIEFTSDANTTYIKTRFGVERSGQTITYSNVNLYKVIDDSNLERISVKYGNGLTVNQNNELEVNIGTGLEFDQSTGAINVIGGGGGGDSIAEGGGITITTDPQTGVKTISVNTGDHLEVDENTGELNVVNVDYTAGQGIFIGNEYQNVEYIKNSGNYDQIILTDIIPAFSDKIELDIKFGAPSVATVWDRPIMGCNGTTPSTFLYTVTLYLASNDSNLGCYNHFKYETGNTGRNFFIRPSGISYDGSSSVRKTLTMKGSTATWGTDSKEFSSEYNSSFIDPQIGIAVFGRAGQSSNTIFNSCELTVYGVKLYDSNDTLLHNLVPVKKLSNNEGGLYDTVTSKFYGNSGNGSFVTGPAVETDDRIINAKIGSGLGFDSNNAIEVLTGAGLSINQDNELEVLTGNGLQINQDGEVEIDPSIIPEAAEYSSGEAITIRDVSQILPAGYVEVDYIEGIGNYTVINYIPNRKTKIVGTASQTQTSYDPVLFGNRTGSNGQQFVFWFNRYDSTQAKVGFVYGTNTWSTSSDCDNGKLIPYTLEDQFTFLISLDDEFNINDSFVHNITENGAPASNLKLGIFALVNSSSDEIESSDQIFRGRMYEFKIYEDDELVVNLIPAVSTSTNQSGFYDVINDIFYTSKTATPFGYDPSTIHSTGKVIDVNYGNGLTVNQNNELEVNIGDGLLVNANNEVELSNATSNTLGGIKVGSGFVYTSDGLLNATPAAPPFDVGDGLELIYDDIDALPNGYGHVDYVCSNPENNSINAHGRARTLIDYVPTNTTKLAIRMQRDSERSDLCFIGSRIASRDHEFCFWNEYSSVTELAFPYGNTNYSNAYVTYPSYITGQIIEVECVVGDTSNTLSVNGTVVKTYTKDGDASPYKLGIFQLYLNGSWANQPANGKIYYIKLYEGNTLAVNLIPAVRLVDEVVGFYDNVNDKFYTSNTEYPFTTDMSTLVIDGAPRTLNVIPATANTIGGIKVGTGLSIAADGTLSTTGGETYDAGNGIEITEVTHEDEFRVQNQEYFFTDHGLTCIITGNYGPRTYTKINDGDIVAAVIGTTGGWYMPLFVGLTEDSVKYSNSYDSNILGPTGSFTYHDKTWYYTADYALTAGDGVDHANHLQSMTDTIYAESNEGKIQAAKDLIDLAVLLPDVSIPAISAKIGAGLSFDANGAIQADAQPLSPATDSTLGGVIVGDGILVDNDGTISVDPTIIPEVIEYEAGTAISIEEVEHGGVTFDAWDSGTGWSNWAYTSATGDGGIPWNPEVHSSVADSWKIPLGATQVRVKAFSTSDVLLHPSIHWLTGKGTGRFGYADPTGGIPYDSWLEVNSNATYMNLGIRRSEGSTVALSPSEVKSVELTFQTVSEIEVDVWNGGTGWLNGDYTSGTSDSFVTNWYYTYHYNYQQYIEVPEGATHVMVRGISNENDSHFEGGGINAFDSNHHHVHWWGCAWEWQEITSDVKYVQPNVKWNDSNTRTISGSDVKSVTLVWKLPALETNQAINVKYGDGLTVNQNNELEVNLGSGLAFDVNGAIEVTGGTGGDSVTAGDAIDITTDSQTGDKIISVNYGEGLTIDPVTGALTVNGQLPEGTIIKKMTFMGNGNGTSHTISFEKKPLAILSIYGSSGTNYIAAIPAPIDAPYLQGNYGGVSTNGQSCSCAISYNDATNELTFTQAYYGGSDSGLIYNANNVTYTVWYLIKGHTEGGTSATNEVSVVKTFTYVGTGTMTNNIQFPETPDMLLSIAGPGGDNTYVTTTPTPINASKLEFAISDGNNNNGVGGALMSFDDTTNVLTLTSSRHVSWAFNTLDTVYQVRYVVNEIIATKPAAGGVYYEAGNAITFNTTSQTSDISIDLFSTMTDWVNKSYDQHVGGNFVNAPEAIHSNVTPLSNLYEIPEPNAKFTIEPLDVNDNLLHCIVDYHDLNGNHIGWNGEFISDPTKQYQCPTGAIFISVAVVHTNHTSAMSVSECKSVTITWKNITETHTTINADVASTSQFGVVKVGSGLSIDPVTGALNVTGGGGGGGGDTVAQGNGINITTDQQTGDKVIAVNAGSGLAFDQTTHALEVSSGVVTSIAPTQNTPGSITVTEGDGTATPVQVLSQMGGATSSTAGTAGYVPAPSSGDDDAYLRGDGTWDDDVVTENDLLTLVFVPDDYTPPTP